MKCVTCHYCVLLSLVMLHLMVSSVVIVCDVIITWRGLAKLYGVAYLVWSLLCQWEC